MDNGDRIKQRELPLWELFSRLQKANFPLGIEEYKLLIEALAQLKEEEIKDPETLKRLCCALWVKSPSDKLRFDTYFQQFVLKNTGEEAIIEPPIDPKVVGVKNKILDWLKSRLNWKTSLVLGSSLFLVGIGTFGFIQDSIKTQQASVNGGNNNPINPINDIPIDPDLPSENPSDSPDINPEQPVEEESEYHGILWMGLSIFLGTTGLIYGGWLLIQTRGKRTSLLSTNSQMIAILPTQLTPDYFPITQRQMKQIWRQARCLVRAGPSTELDVKATVKEISRQGFLLKPVLLPRRVNRTQLLLLLDSSKSMFPFQALCYQLKQTAQDSGRFEQTWIYYFDNVPLQQDQEFQLCPDFHCFEYQPIKTLLSQFHPNYGGVLIVSDGGAIRGRLNKKRLLQTRKFIAQLKEHTDKISWLNPLPPSRWDNTTAEEISKDIPMFELNRTGLETAIIAWRKK